MLCFVFNDTATTEIYTLSLHDALPIYAGLLGAVAVVDLLLHGRLAVIGARGADRLDVVALGAVEGGRDGARHPAGVDVHARSEEHTSEPPVTPISRMPSSS